jgi:hypothetical protein
MSRSSNSLWVNIAVVLVLIAGAVYIFNHISWRTFFVVASLAVAVAVVFFASRASGD